jgi:hypothetical protein
MLRNTIALALILSGIYSFAQNDVDAIRYSRLGSGGTSRFMAMGGAFGAIGADLSCGAYNPAGLGVYRKGDIAFSGSLRFTNTDASLYNKTTSMSDASAAFNNFGIAGAWKAASDPDSRHVLAFNVTQLQNYNNSVQMSGYTNSNSIAKDMLNLANQDGSTGNLDPSYEGLGFDNFLLDTLNNKFYSLLDTKRAVKQTRNLVTSGKVNDLNFSYAHSYKDKYYIGVSIGVPQVSYVSTSTHSEVDDRDSMRVGFTTATTYTSTYIGGIPAAYPQYLGFNSLTYTQYLKTTGSGINLKLGAIARVNDALRVGFYYHTPTFYKMTDQYYNSISVAFDANPSNPLTEQYPANSGYFNYKIVTPSVLGFNAAFLVKKLAVIGVDYELINYKTAQLKNDADDAVTDFSATNQLIKDKYRLGQNFKIGAEINTKPVMFRAGYNMQGSPFGDAFTGDFVRHTFSLGLGIRTKSNVYFDVTWAKTLSNETYQLFTTLDAVSKIKYDITMISATIGAKF